MPIFITFALSQKKNAMNESLRLRMEDMFLDADRLIAEQKIGEAFARLTSMYTRDARVWKGL